ncbi:hypothetical protein LguiB_023042 [Lonicera macranthoides]
MENDAKIIMTRRPINIVTPVETNQVMGPNVASVEGTPGVRGNALVIYSVAPVENVSNVGKKQQQKKEREIEEDKKKEDKKKENEKENEEEEKKKEKNKENKIKKKRKGGRGDEEEEEREEIFVSGSSRPASQGVTHPGIALVHYSLNFGVRLTSEFLWDPKPVSYPGGLGIDVLVDTPYSVGSALIPFVMTRSHLSTILSALGSVLYRPQPQDIYPHGFVSGSSRPASQGVTHPGIALVHYSLNFGVLMGSEASRPCVACAHSHKRCPLYCDYARIFPNVIDREDYHTIFSVFGVRNVASFLQRVPEDRLFEAISSYLLEATARIENPVRGCTALLASFEQKVEELQARVTALEARLGGGSSCVNPLCSFAPPEGSSRFFSSVENNVPNVIPTAVNLSEPIAGENGALLTEMDWSYDQAALDAVYQGASNNFLSQSALDDFVVDFAEPTGLDWTASGNIHHDFFDSSSSDLSTVLNFDADDFQILQPFLND